MNPIPVRLNVAEEFVEVLHIHLLLLQLLLQNGHLALVLLEVGAHVLLPGGGQVAVGEARHPGLAKVRVHARRVTHLASTVGHRLKTF